jgi:hypothetical protein
MNSCGFRWKAWTQPMQMQDFLGSGRSSISSIGISTLPHQQPSASATPQWFGFPQNGHEVSGVEKDMFVSP